MHSITNNYSDTHMDQFLYKESSTVSSSLYDYDTSLLSYDDTTSTKRKNDSADIKKHVQPAFSRMKGTMINIII